MNGDLPRRLWILATGVLALNAAAAPAASVAVDATAAPDGRSISAQLFGTNVQWADRGDGLIGVAGHATPPRLLAALKRLAPTVIRYPGGSDTDLYPWRAGVGKVRGKGERFGSGARQTIEFGTLEFLELCEELRAEPLVTVNMATSSPSEAAAWLRAINVDGMISRRTGRRLAKVRYWEIGNEPYLRDERQKKLWMTAAQYAQRAGETIAALRGVDPAIRIGIPLRSDRIGDQYATPIQGYNSVVLDALKGQFDFVAVHNAYLPFSGDKVHDEDSLYLSAMAASAVTAEDIAATVKAVRATAPARPVSIAITEYAPLFTLNGRASDGYIASAAAGLYVADMLRLFATIPEVRMANHWSLVGNWHFGAVKGDGSARPAGEILALMRPLAGGKFIPLQIKGPTFTSPGVGFVPPMSALPTITGAASLNDRLLSIVLINKDPRQSHSAQLRLPASTLEGAIRARRFTAGRRFTEEFQLVDLEVQARSAIASINLPPASVTRIDVMLGREPR